MTTSSICRVPKTLGKKPRKVCCGMIRGVLAALETNSEWQLEVSDESGKPLYLFRFAAESFNHLDQRKTQSRA